MRKVVNKNLVIFSLLLVLCASLFLGYKSFNNKKDIPEKYKTNSERKQFAMFIKNSSNNQYETYEGDSFPEGYRANLDKSLCTDINGNIVNDVISNSENGITVTSNKTVYCEIYMDEKTSTAEDITNTPVDGVLEPTGVAQDELIMRYYGTNPPNYICFGTSDKDICVNDTDKYMYRIIGIDKSNRFKVIKKEALNMTYRWHSYTTDIKWPQSIIYSEINGSAFLNNSTYIPSGWSDKIETIVWKYGDFTDINKSAAEIVQIEQSWTTTTSAKIGLIYLADYYYAYQKEGLNCSSSGQYTTCKINWMFWLNNDSSAQNTACEWTMPRYYLNSNGKYYVGCVTSDGITHYAILEGGNLVFPVFYIVATAEIKGTGTIDDPYIITN